MSERSGSGPYRVARRFIVSHLALALLSLAGGAAALAYYGGECLDHAAALQREQRIWHDGEPARRASLEVSTEDWWYALERHRFEVTYELVSGETRTGSVELETLFGSLTTDAEVRVSRDDPEDFALRSAVDAAPSRWAAIAFTAIAGGAVGFVLLGLALAFLLRIRRVRLAAASGTPRLCRLAERRGERHEGKATGYEVFRFEVQVSEDAPPRVASYRCRTARRPGLTADKARLVLAMVPASAPGQAIVLQEGFYPLALSAEQAQAVEALLRAPPSRPTETVMAISETEVKPVGEPAIMPTELVRGPFPVLPGYQRGRVGLAALMLAVAVAAGVLPGPGKLSDLEALVAEGRVWRDGEPAVSAQVSGREVVGSPYPHSLLEVTYETVAGERFARPLEVRSLFGSIDLSRPAEVRVARGDASAFALNLAVEASGPRWALALLVLIGRVVLGALALFQAVDFGRELYRVRRAAATGVAVFCPLLRREPLFLRGQPMGWDRLLLEVPTSAGGPVAVEYRFRTRRRAAITLDEGRLVLAVVPPEAPRHAIVVDQSFDPLGYSENQQRQFLSAFELAANSVAAPR